MLILEVADKSFIISMANVTSMVYFALLNRFPQDVQPCRYSPNWQDYRAQHCVSPGMRKGSLLCGSARVGWPDWLVFVW
jgi:hypothetical protein